MPHFQLQRAPHWKPDFYSHAIGVPLALVGMSAIVARGIRLDAPVGHVLLGAAFCASFLMVFTVSALYHRNFRHADERRFLRWNRMDRVAIFIAIATSATAHAWMVDDFPRPLATFSTLFCWLIAIAGVLIELTRRPRETDKTTPLYFLMTMPLVAFLVSDWPQRALWSPATHWVAAGLVVYTAGSLVFAIDSIQDIARQRAEDAGEPPPLALPYTHAVWHLFVIVGSAFHYRAVWLGLS